MTRALSSNTETPEATCETCGWFFDNAEPGECPACAIGVDMRDDEDEQ